MTTKRVYLKVALLRRGLTARHVAARLHISEWTLSRIVNGRQEPDRALMRRLLRVIASPPPRRRRSRKVHPAGRPARSRPSGRRSRAADNEAGAAPAPDPTVAALAAVDSAKVVR